MADREAQSPFGELCAALIFPGGDAVRGFRRCLARGASFARNQRGQQGVVARPQTPIARRSLDAKPGLPQCRFQGIGRAAAQRRAEIFDAALMRGEGFSDERVVVEGRLPTAPAVDGERGEERHALLAEQRDETPEPSLRNQIEE